MTTLTTKLVKDGNSKAIRLNSTVLAMSGLQDDVLLEVYKDRVIIRPLSKKLNEWEQLIDQEISRNPKALETDPELDDWDSTLNDGFN